MRFYVVGLLAILLLGGVGCGSGQNGEHYVAVTGTVTVAGRPVPDLVVTFTPEKGLPSRGMTDASGHFTLRSPSGHDGVLVGGHKVSLQLRGVKEDRELAERVSKLGQDPAIQKVLKNFGNPDRTTLTREVKENNQVIDLNLD